MRNNIINRAVVAISCLMLVAAPVSAQTAQRNVCEPVGYVVGFFNGVWNTRIQAELGLSIIRDSMFGETYNGEKVEYELFYNQTGSDREGVTMLEDLAEVFQQRSTELDRVLANRWELFWEALGSSSDEASFIERFRTSIGRVSSQLASLLSAVYSDITARSVAGWAYLLSNPPTAADYATHHTRIKALAIENKKLALFAHSQGNLFANYAYDAAMTVTSPESVKVVHVAPASPTLRGGHSLADLDLVINGLRLQGIDSIPPITVGLPASHLVTDDFSGHKLVETYLNMRRDTYPQVRTLLQTALDTLESQMTGNNASFFTVTLTWDGTGDVDLHVFEPGGNHVYYAALQGASGYLDYDNVVAYGPEHYYVTCDADALQQGTYSVGINNYAQATGRTATVQIATHTTGEIFSTQLDVGPALGSSGNASPIFVGNVLVWEDEQGQFQAVMQ